MNKIFKRLIKSEIYDGFNYFNKYCEVFKNPTLSEIEDTIINDSHKSVRGLLYKDGTVYIWPSFADHIAVENKDIILDYNQYHFFTEGNDWMKIHTNGQNINYEELKKAMKSAENILRNIVNLDDSNIEISNLDGEGFYETYDKFLNLKKDEKIEAKRLIKSEIYDAFDYSDDYIEIFKNPTSREVDDTFKYDGDVRGLLYKDGTVYIWPSNLLHEDIKDINKKLDYNQYHFYTASKNMIKFHRDGALIDYEELKSAIEKSIGIFGNIVNLDSSKIEVPGLKSKDSYYNYYEGKFQDFLNEIKKRS